MTTIVQGRRSQSYEPLLLENEREAVADLLQYLESSTYFFLEPLRSLTLVIYRPNHHQLLHRLSTISPHNPLLF